MDDFIVRSPDQLPQLLRAFRKQAGLTQAEAALRLGVTQQALSALERNAETITMDRLMRLLSTLGVELVLRRQQPYAAAQTNPASGLHISEPDW